MFRTWQVPDATEPWRCVLWRGAIDDHGFRKSHANGREWGDEPDLRSISLIHHPKDGSKTSSQTMTTFPRTLRLWKTWVKAAAWNAPRSCERLHYPWISPWVLQPRYNHALAYTGSSRPSNFKVWEPALFDSTTRGLKGMTRPKNHKAVQFNRMIAVPLPIRSDLDQFLWPLLAERTQKIDEGRTRREKAKHGDRDRRWTILPPPPDTCAKIHVKFVSSKLKNWVTCFDPEWSLWAESRPDFLIEQPVQLAEKLGNVVSFRWAFGELSWDPYCGILWIQRKEEMFCLKIRGLRKRRRIGINRKTSKYARIQRQKQMVRGQKATPRSGCYLGEPWIGKRHCEMDLLLQVYRVGPPLKIEQARKSKFCSGIGSPSFF